MTAAPGHMPALRWRLHAPVASFRNPLFAGAQIGLPVVPPSTIRGSWPPQRAVGSDLGT